MEKSVLCLLLACTLHSLWTHVNATDDDLKDAYRRTLEEAKKIIIMTTAGASVAMIALASIVLITFVFCTKSPETFPKPKPMESAAEYVGRGSGGNCCCSC